MLIDNCYAFPGLTQFGRLVPNPAPEPEPIVGEILEFPSQQAQGLAFLDQQLRVLLASRGADQQLIDFAVDQLTRIYGELSESEQYSFAVELPESISAPDRDSIYRQITGGLEGIRRENHALMVKLIAQLVLAEVRLFQHERPD